jgi:hypothetical protein
MYRYGWESSPHTLEVIMAGGIDRCNPKVSIWIGIKPISIPWDYIYLCHQLLSPLICVGLIPIHIDTLGLHLSMPPATITSNMCRLVIMAGGIDRCIPKVSIWMGIKPTHIRGDSSWWSR